MVSKVLGCVIDVMIDGGGCAGTLKEVREED